ncbi:bifunctional phosphopantothenoylcysteine decarboxylase/phosphopantothenate--cysteine ligase CoaBC [Albibacterium profundi]|uniref:Coenzyme A biosynthesis bifunctional protein CoaBC n=1 Tax=Albibacterium profundi TaxID=3134906 RepID=A0ABV5CCI2_9SPHI
MLKDKNIILGVCGSIAAYKSAFLLRLLVKAGANVQVIMTQDAVNFITPLSLSTLSKRPVLTDYFNAKTGEWNNHVDLGLWADLVLIAPASANSIAKFATGICDNLLSAVYLSARCPVYLAPAMDLDMWAHPSTQSNISRLNSYGNHLIQPAKGELASGLFGEGRLAEPEEIVDHLQKELKTELRFRGKKVLVTAGPTHEAIDPVRFIGNHSSGKMGYAIAHVLQDMGAEVTLISGPSYEQVPNGVKLIKITSAQELLDACLENFDNTDITVMSAAVADYRPKVIADQKIKKKSDSLSIELEKTRDILKTLGTRKTDKQILIGFALETQNEIENAEGKLVSKNLDFIVLNSLQDQGAGFAGDQNKITIINRTGEHYHFELKAKVDVAKDIANHILSIL